MYKYKRGHNWGDKASLCLSSNTTSRTFTSLPSPELLEELGDITMTSPWRTFFRTPHPQVTTKGPVCLQLQILCVCVCERECTLVWFTQDNYPLENVLHSNLGGASQGCVLKSRTSLFTPNIQVRKPHIQQHAPPAKQWINKKYFFLSFYYTFLY